MSVAAITAERLSVSSGERTLIRDLDLHVHAGKVLGITGPSGCGKTTLHYALGGLMPPVAGRVLVDGRPAVLWRDAPAAIIFQTLGLVSVLSAQETVALPLQTRNLTKAEVEGRSRSALASLGLADHASQLVGGPFRRTAPACRGGPRFRLAGGGDPGR